jgi:hypothetical protein
MKISSSVAVDFPPADYPHNPNLKTQTPHYHIWTLDIDYWLLDIEKDL